MHLHSKIRLSGAVALLAVWLAFVSVSACSNGVLFGQACAAACGEDNPKGFEIYKTVAGDCVHEGCSDACRKSPDHMITTPTDACLPCVQAALKGAPCKYAGLFGVCHDHPECDAYVDCIIACPSK